MLCVYLGCFAERENGAFMCGKHWDLVPIDERNTLTEAYRYWGSMTGHLARDKYRQAVREACRCVRIKLEPVK